MITENNFGFLEIERQMNPKKKIVVENFIKVLTKHRFQESVLSTCHEKNGKWRMSVVGI